MQYTAQYTKIDSGYMRQIVEWPAVVTEGSSIDDCREMLRDAIEQMILAHRELGIEIHVNKVFLEKIDIEPKYVG